MKLALLTILAACASTPPAEPYTMPATFTRDGTRAPPTPPSPPSGPEAEYAELADKAAARMTAIAQALSPTTTRECAAVMAELTALAPRFAGTTAAVTRIMDAGRARVLGYALERHATSMSAAARVILGSPTLAACSSDAPFLAALDDAWAL